MPVDSVEIAKGIAAKEGRTGTKRVLIAEDNPINLKMLVYYLSTLQIEFDTASSGEAVLDALERRDYALILMDCLMPEIDGYEATQLIRKRADARFCDIPIIGVTSESENNDEARCLAAGMNGYLAKPLRLKSLQSILERWLAPDQLISH